jgi:hypothetical protein
MNGLHGPLGFSGTIGMEKIDWAIWAKIATKSYNTRLIK